MPRAGGDTDPYRSTDRNSDARRVLRDLLNTQPDAINAISRAIRRARAGIKEPRRPIGSFVFLGPTGVGKTLLARALAEFMFGDDEALIQLDMSEYIIMIIMSCKTVSIIGIKLSAIEKTDNENATTAAAIPFGIETAINNFSLKLNSSFNVNHILLNLVTKRTANNTSAFNITDN